MTVSDAIAGRIDDSHHEAVVKNLGLVFAYVIGRPKFERDKDDLIQEGTKGLMEAVRTYDRDGGMPFGVYAIPRIKRYIHKYLAENRSIKVPLSSFKGRTTAWKAVAAALRVQSFEAVRERQGTGEGIEPADERADEAEVREKREAIDRALSELPDRLREQISCIYLDETGLRAYARDAGCDYRHLLRRRDKAFEAMRVSLEAQGWTIEDHDRTTAKGA